MLADILEYIPALYPLEGFRLQGKVPYLKKEPTSSWMQKKASLPNLCSLLGQEKFAEVAVAWNEKGLFLHVSVDHPFTEALYPSYFQADAFELFVDTRDAKQSRFFTSFCHCFVFLPKAVQGIQAHEINRFRGEDTHPLCSAQELHCKTRFKRSGYEMDIYIEASAIHGFDPSAFSRLGLGYRIYRKGEPWQQFCVGASHFSLEQQPQFWASFSLTHE